MPSLRKCIPAAFCALCLAAGSGIAGAQKAPKHPTRAEVKRYEAASAQLWREAVYTNAVNLDLLLRTVDWNKAYVPPAPIVVSAPASAPQHQTGVRPAPSGGASTGACGGATNGADAFIARESGGNPSARNPSGATGCYQIMPGTWSGSCSDLGSQSGASTGAQAACASRLPLSSWSASGPT